MKRITCDCDCGQNCPQGKVGSQVRCTVNVSTYWERLKKHPGLGTALLFTVLGALAGAGNKNFSPEYGALFGGLSTGVIVWGLVLFSNKRR